MSLISWFLKSKKQMSKENTKWVRVGKYLVTSHAQHRIADPSRNLSKTDMVINLLGKSKNSTVYFHKKDNTYQYDRVNKNNRTITHITTKNHVKSINRYHKKNEHKQYKKF